MVQSQLEDNELRLKVVFFKTQRSNEPVREWLKFLSAEDKRILGDDIKTAQYGWLLGMPLIRKMESGLWEVRSTLSSGIARVLFTVQGNVMVLLHGLSKNLKRPHLMNCK